MRALTAALWAAIAAAALPPTAARAQTASATVTAGPEYGAGPVKTFLLGASYRDLWTQPVRVQVLDLGTFAGGLTPTGPGGGNQTVSLRFQGADGREYSFRSVNKEQTRALDADLKGTVVDRLIQDQVSSLFPAGTVVADSLLTAAGVLHPSERLYVMPDDPRLGEYRQRFAGMLGTVEERTRPGQTLIAGLAGADRLAETDSFLVELRAGPGERFDARGYLAARLMDMYLGDWDRHADNFRFARFPAAGGHLWRVVPRDRDYVFSDYDGLLLGVLRTAVPNAVRFGGDYSGVLSGYMMNAEVFDRALLGALTRADFNAVAAGLRARLADGVIAGAVGRLPPEWRAHEGERLARLLEQRRDLLPALARRYYERLFREAEVHATDAADYAEAERLPDGNLEVRLYAQPGGEPYFRRWYSWWETREVRIYLHGGADRARVFGGGPEQVIVRVIGGEGDDTLADETRSGGHTAFYDGEGANTFRTRGGTKVDRRGWKEPVPATPGDVGRAPRTSGGSASSVAPSGGWRSAGVGPYVGVGPSVTRYGFRRYPYASQQSVRALWAVQHGRFGAEYRGDFVYVGGRDHTDVLARVSDMEAVRFFGYGNDTPREGAPSSRYRVWERQIRLDPTYHRMLAPRTWASLGATARLTDPEPVPGTPAFDDHPRGAEQFLIAGARAGFTTERGDTTTFRRRGWTLTAQGDAYPFARHDAEPFGSARAVGTAYLWPGAGPVLALRAGGARVWGDFPLQYAALLGGTRTLRGFATERFAGDASAYGSAELRQVVTRAKLLVRGDLGVFALGDAGRVWYRGDSPGGWHVGTGGGVFFTILDRSRTVSLAWAHGERGSLHFQLGMPF